MSGLRIGGLVPFSTVDLPGRNAAVVFCQGCPWRCRYCHNPHLLDRSGEAPRSWAGFLDWLEPRRGFLDGIVFSGGEPTLQPALGAAMEEVGARGLALGLHTNGHDPAALRPLLPRLEWVGLDIKAPWEAYDRITGVRGAAEAVRASLDGILRSGVPYELRTTCHPDLLSSLELREMARQLARAGARNWVLQPFRPEGCRDPALAAPGHPAPGLDWIADLGGIFREQGADPAWVHHRA
jgi:pyruvate formate lyase activating enzyme